jgi:tetratricopeptide (TPR) repeat protein
MKCLIVFIHFVLGFQIVCASSCLGAEGAENLATNGQPVKTDETNVQETLRSYLQLQEQIHATQLSIEQTRKEAEELATRNAQALSGRLEAIEGALASQRARELEAMQSSNRVMLFMAGTFAAVGFIAMVLMGYFQWRTVHGLAEISAVLPSMRSFPSGPAIAALGPGDANLIPGPVEQSNARLLGALEQLEKRIHELERTSKPALDEGNPGANSLEQDAGHPNGKGDALETSTPQEPATSVPAGNCSARVKALLTTGQALLDQDKADSALASFEEALSLDPQHAEAMVKKGTALERLQKVDEAIACYDRAIAADSSLTIAYLHKGGLFNRLERFDEALECYERALRTQEKKPA